MFEWSDVMIFGFLTLLMQMSIIPLIVLRLPYIKQYIAMNAQTQNNNRVTEFKTYNWKGAIVIPVFSLGVFALMLFFMDEIKKGLK